jgi:SAM-dependent methyltransferase
MLSLLQTAERVASPAVINNYVYQRHAFAYRTAIRYLGDHVVELGCGSGYGMQLLAPSCNWYVGLDKYIPNNRKASINTAFFKAIFPDLYNIGDRTFDTVICFQVIEHIRKDDQLIKEIYRILKPGGRLLLTTPNRLMSLTRNPFHVREYTPDSIHRLIGCTFSAFEVKGIYGNDVVKDYYESNRKNVEKIARWDLFNLQYRLPAALLKVPYSILNNLNRASLSNNNPAESAAIRHDDFYTSRLTGQCLDFFVMAEKKD